MFNASDTRVSHCDFSGYRPDTNVHKGCVQLDGPSLNNNGIQRVLIDYCHMHDIVNNVSNLDPCNLLQIGTAGGTWNNKCGAIVDHCLVNNISRNGSGEFFVCKTSEVTFRYCTFTNMAPGAAYASQYLQQRQGSGIEVRSCWFENMSNTALNVWDCPTVPEPTRRPLIIGNVMRGGLNIRAPAGNNQPGDTGVSPPGRYFACTQARFIGNQLQNGFIQVGQTQTLDPPTTTPAEDCNVVISGPRQNTRTAGGNPYTLGLENNTTLLDDTAADNDGNAPPAFTLAVQLTVGSGAGQVGMTAPDPLCPSGPQS